MKSYGVRHPARRQHGLTLLEVLIAVLVLGVGLLALAALQSSLARNAAETRARTQVASFAEMLIEQQRAAGFGAIQSIADIQALEDPTARADLVALEGMVGTVTGRVDVQDREWRENNDPSGRVLAEYRVVTATLGWNGADGEARELSMSTVVSPIALSFNPVEIDLDDVSGLRARPVVRTRSPAGPGVIPIAIGDDSETAATNPRPEVLGQGGNTSIVGTRFDVLTFQNLDNNLVQVQQRVETQVIKCDCEFGRGITDESNVFFPAQWPAYWNGFRYTVFSPGDDTPPPGALVNSGPASTGQSPLCLECCRDHHDRSNESAESLDRVRFSRLPEHQHFRIENGEFVLSGGAGRYLEACRLVRVDGFWQVATDMRLEHMGLLETAADNRGERAKLPTPDERMAERYADFVLDFLRRYAPNLNGVGTDADELYAGTPHELVPASLNVRKPEPRDDRWLHSRGLYVDFLEKDARDAIRAFCAGGQEAISAGCYLPHVPFTSVNVTELAFWRSLQQATLEAARSDALAITTRTNTFGDATNPVAGNAYATARATTDPAFAESGIGPSNSGIAVWRTGVRPEDTVWNRKYQRFNFPGGDDGLTGRLFLVSLAPEVGTSMPHLSDGSAANVPSVDWSNVAGTKNGFCSDNQGQSPNPYRCVTSLEDEDDGLGARVVVGKYNRSYTQTEVARCEATNADRVIEKSVPVRYCVNYEVTRANVVVDNAVLSGTVSAPIDDGKMAERTAIDFGVVPELGEIQVWFRQQSVEKAPILTCLAANSPQVNNQNHQIVYADCP